MMGLPKHHPQVARALGVVGSLLAVSTGLFHPTIAGVDVVVPLLLTANIALGTAVALTISQPDGISGFRKENAVAGAMLLVVCYYFLSLGHHPVSFLQITAMFFCAMAAPQFSMNGDDADSKVSLTILAGHWLVVILIYWLWARSHQHIRIVSMMLTLAAVTAVQITFRAIDRATERLWPTARYSALFAGTVFAMALTAFVLFEDVRHEHVRVAILDTEGLHFYLLDNPPGRYMHSTLVVRPVSEANVESHGEQFPGAELSRWFAEMGFTAVDDAPHRSIMVANEDEDMRRTIVLSGRNNGASGTGTISYVYDLWGPPGAVAQRRTDMLGEANKIAMVYAEQTKSLPPHTQLKTILLQREPECSPPTRRVTIRR